MTPRLMVICLGGLAGAGALVCCDLDEGAEPLDTQPDGEAVEAGVEEDRSAGAEADPSSVH